MTSLILTSILAASTGLSCPDTKIVNQTSEEWNESDTINLEAAKVGCGKRYPEAPCVAIFTKVQPLVYRVICGGEK